MVGPYGGPWGMKIEPYDQVLALTQHMVNTGIKALYKSLQIEQEADGVKRVPKVDAVVKKHRNYMKDVVFGPPTVTFVGDHREKSKVILGLHLKSGKLKLSNEIDQDDEDAPPVMAVWNANIKDWTIDMPVNLSLIGVNPATERGQAIKNRILAKKGIDHSIKELILDLDSMSTGDLKWQMGTWTDEDKLTRTDKKSESRPYGWKEGESRDFLVFGEESRIGLKVMAELLARELKRQNLHSLGYVVTANRSSTLEVTHVRYMTYPWTNARGQTVGHGLDREARLNYLLYLEMVDDHKPPEESAANALLDTRMGNWTDGYDTSTSAGSKFGTFVLSASNFTIPRIVSRFVEIDKFMTLDMHKIEGVVGGNVLLKTIDVAASLSVGLLDASPDLRRIERGSNSPSLDDDWPSEAKDFFRPLTESPGRAANIWSCKFVQRGNDGRHWKGTGPSLLGSFEFEIRAETITLTRLHILPQSNEIVYEGQTWTRFSYEKLLFGSALQPAITSKGHLICTCKWKVTLILTEVTDGGIEIDIREERPYIVSDSKAFRGLFDGIEQQLEQGYGNAAKSFDHFLQSLRNCLQGQEKFVLPASGVFFFKNPVMDAYANLICELEYDSAVKITDVNEFAGKKRSEAREGPAPAVPKVIKSTGRYEIK